MYSNQHITQLYWLTNMFQAYIKPIFKRHIDWHATGLPHKHLGLYCVDPLCAACVCFPPSTTEAPAPLRACGPLVEEPRTARAEQSPLLARKESFGQEMTDRILSYRFDFHVTVRDF
jgi:hypothetical protein